jgi:alkyl sulfatase BDS1-like metallo-beta-lactamase superfamily hydrolase
MLRAKSSATPLLLAVVVAAVAGYYLGATANGDRPFGEQARAGQAGAAGQDTPKAAGDTDTKDTAPNQSKLFDAKTQPPSNYTLEVLKKVRTELPFADKKDFEEQQRGFIAAPKFKTIKADAGHVAWDMERFSFLTAGREFDTIHPSLVRQSTLNMNYGLYKVIDGIYQVRGFDLGHISFVKGKTGWIIFDPLTAKETARAALELVDEHLGKHPVVAVVYSHSHGDHFAGVRGVTDDAELRAGKVQIIAPRGFMEHAVAENVYAGNAMSRRLFYQYGVQLPASPGAMSGKAWVRASRPAPLP